MKTALIMAAGTGGHIYPGLAIAEVLVARGWRIAWMATPAGMEHKLVGRAGYDIHIVDMAGVRSKGVIAWLTLPVRLLRALWQSLRLMRRTKPAVVISMGGYIAFPGGIVAAMLGIPLVVHEPGAHAGLTNRVLALIANRVLVGFPNTFAQVPKNAVAKLLPRPNKIEWLGTPVRMSITQIAPPAVRLSNRSGAIRLLIVGGSLGAKSLNDLVVAALATLPLEMRPQVIHQSGEKNYAELVEAYRLANVDAKVLPFIDNMDEMYSWCDVILCRSGAITIAELAAAGIASILVPLPYFVAEEQDANARFLADAGAGVLVKQLETTAQKLSELIASFTREKALQMATIARGLGRPDATAACAAACMALANKVA